TTRRRPAPSRRSRPLPALPPPPDPSLLDDLRSYPLRIRSDICKATGGDRWMHKLHRSRTTWSVFLGAWHLTRSLLRRKRQRRGERVRIRSSEMVYVSPRLITVL